MKSAAGLALVLYVMVHLFETGRVMADSGMEIKLYQTMVDEYYTMLSEVEPYHLIGYKTSCHNFCNKNTAEDLRRSADDCHCDKHCVEFRDCCLDYWKSCNSSFVDAFNHSQLFECMEPILKISNHTKMYHSTSGKTGYQVVAKCPETFRHPELRRKCENPYQTNPFVLGKDGRTFRNHYCALCNGIGTWTTWNTSLDCVNSTFQLIQERLKKNNFTFSNRERELIRNTCVVKMSPPRGANTFQCRIVTECEKKTDPDYFKCALYKQQLYSFFVPTVRNPHCVRCSGNLLVFYSLISNQKTEGTDNSMAILFDFSKASQIYGSEKVDRRLFQRCPEDEIFDFQQSSCRKPRITSEIKNTNWTCEFMNETFPNSSAYILIFQNGSLYVPAHKKMYKRRQYFWNEGNITVCGNLTRTFTNSIKRSLNTQLYSNIEFNLTAAGYTLSIFALLLVLLTYSLFSELRNFPGKIVMNLAVALLSSQLVFLVDMFENISGDFCKGLAVLLHFLYLASFCWMNVIAFDVVKTFARKGRRSQRQTQNRAFVLCFLYGWGLPLLLICITLSVDSSGSMDIGYGNVHYCWITNPLALSIFFIAPVMMMIVFNIVALVLVVILIRRERKTTKAVIDKSTTKQDFSICWKLTVVFGLTWILGVVAPYHIAIRIAFILCNSLQGFFLMVGFIMTKRTLNMYLRMAGMRPLVTRTGPTRSTLSNSRRRRSSSSTGKAWERAKPTSKQDEVRTGLEENTAIKKSVEEQEITEVKTIETDV